MHSETMRALRAVGGAGLALFLTGCAGLAEQAQRESRRAEAPPQVAGRDGRERALQQAWVGRTRADLVRVFGQPSLVMDVPGNRVPESLVLVYTGKDPVGGCIDAFVVLTNEAEEIWNYFCR